ncbi:coiled-coil domain-containing protein 191 [Pholidichthys leucotaenia]
MTFPSHNPHLFTWRSRSANKIHVKNDDIDQWRKQVEMASEFAMSEVFHHKKPRSGISSFAVPLQTSDQLRDYDEAYSEDLYNCLTEEEEGSAVNSFLQDLMEHELFDSGMMGELALDAGQLRKKFRNPILTMEARHQQVRENRTRREAERLRQQREREVQRGAREEARRRERGEEMKRKREERRQEEMMQLEMVRLRRQVEEKRCLEQLVRQRERERTEAERTSRNLQSAPTLLTKQQQQQDTERLYKEQGIQAKIHISNLKCLQRHFYGWYTLVLSQRLRMGKALALCDWKRKLRAWRAWRTVVWAEQKQREVARTEDALRIENRRCQLAVESHWRRLLQRCLNEWQLWCQTQKEQRRLLVQQQEIKQKMAALISAASAGRRRATETPTCQQITGPPQLPKQPETTAKVGQHRPASVAPPAPMVHQQKTPEAQPSQPWQVNRRHAAPTATMLCETRQNSKSTVSPGSRFENRHAVQQQIIAQQRKLLKEQQEQIARLKQEQNTSGLELEMKKSALTAQPKMSMSVKEKSSSSDLREQRAQRETDEPDNQRTPSRKAVTRQRSPHPIIAAMEARARQRAERRKEIEEFKKKKEEEKLAEMKAAAEQRQREEEEEKRRAAEKRRQEKRLEREREEENQRQLKRHQELLRLARQHYHRTLILRRGLVPWKRLIQLRQASIELAESHRNLVILRLCILGWQQSARESLSEKEACADQLHQHFLLRRSVSCWKRLRDIRIIQEERAERFYRTRTLRRFLLALLDHVTEERLVEWDHQELAQEHNNRRVLQRCFVTWRQLPFLLCKEREREARREKLCRKVSEVLPDFCSYQQ